MKAYVYDSKTNNGMILSDNHHLRCDECPKNHLVVQVKSVSINPIDYKKPDVPFLGWGINSKPVAQDFAGTVILSGSNKFQVGDNVFGFCSHCLTEKIIVSDSVIAKKPPSITFHEASSLPTVAMTSLQALRKGGARIGSKVAVIGASGGCGIMGVMIARQLVGQEGKVIGICGTSNADFVKSLGADAIVDYKDPLGFSGDSNSSLTKHRPLDVVYDTVTSSDPSDSVGGISYDTVMAPFCGPNTMTVAINGGASRWIRMFTGWQGSGYALLLMNANAADLDQIGAWAEVGAIQPKIDSVFDFSEEGCSAAYGRLKSRRSRGKVVINVLDGDSK